jgi:glycosyltransferase involved in cell wall biosynthesis
MGDMRRPTTESDAPRETRPRWSVMIPTYNCASHLRETLASVLAQDPGTGSMQIEIVDDCSTSDDPAAVVAELGAGRVTFFRQPRNVGHVANFNSCVQRARGDLVHILHGDDVVRDGFYERMDSAFRREPGIGAAFCRVIVMDESGHWQFLKPLLQSEPGLLRNHVRRIAVEHPIPTPSIVVKRAVYDDVGGFDSRFRSSGEDIEMWLRIAARFPVWYEPEPLALYRMRESSLTGNAIRTGLNIREATLAVESFRPHLPEVEREEIVRASRRNIALWAVQLSRHALSSGEYRTAARQAAEAVRCSRAPAVLWKTVGLGGYALRRQVRRVGARVWPRKSSARTGEA